MKNSKGITMISLIITIAVMVIISGVTVSISMDRFKINNLKKMQSDIELLNDKIEAYYLKYGGLPILKANDNNVNYTYSELTFNRDVNDNSNYFIIDLSCIGNITLNYGEEGYNNPNTTDDVYIVNEKSHTVYYVKGVKYKDGLLYHSLELNQIQNTNEIGPTKPEINIISKNDTTIEVEIIPGKDNTSGIQKTEYNIKSTDIEKNVTQSENTEISDRTVVGDLSINKAHEITAITTSNNGITSQNIYKINEWIEKLNIGDYVNYSVHIPDVTLTDESQIIKDLTEYSGNTDSTQNTASTITQGKNIGWRVLDVKNGKLRLISANSTSAKVELRGYNGYNNGVYLIDNLCDVLYSSTKGKASSVKIEDIYKFLTYDYTSYTNSKATYGEIKEYIENRMYPEIYAREIGCISVSDTENTGNNLRPSEQGNIVMGSLTAKNRLKVTMTNWNKDLVLSDFKLPIYYTLYTKNESKYYNYWISSRCVNCTGHYAYFGLHAIANSIIGGPEEYVSNGAEYNRGYGLRPVTTLNSDVEIGEKVDGVWQIK